MSTNLNKENIVFWDMTPCNLVEIYLLRGSCCLHRQGRSVITICGHTSTLLSPTRKSLVILPHSRICYSRSSIKLHMIAKFLSKLFPFAYIREIRSFLPHLTHALEDTPRILITFCAFVLCICTCMYVCMYVGLYVRMY
jgi:hypothetical protein